MDTGTLAEFYQSVTFDCNFLRIASERGKKSKIVNGALTYFQGIPTSCLFINDL